MSALAILLVEDHEDSARMLARLLQKRGYVVTTALSFANALAAAARMGAIDVLLCDITLPDGDGCALLRVLQERMDGAPRHAIALTGHDDAHWVEECRRAGYHSYLVKPVAFDQLLAALPPANANPALGGIPSPRLEQQGAAAQ
jgi:CheY-like chemotaxis protein